MEKIAAKNTNVSLKVFQSRSGKIRIVNSLVGQIPRSSDSILILCDANVEWSPTAARQLACHFKDEKVGIVASNVVDRDISEIGIAAEEATYVNMENSVKCAEGKIWGRMMGAFGACYAMRRNLYKDVPDHFNVDDFYETMVTYEKGYDGLVDLDAICYESVSEEISEEFRRKKRISKGNFQNFRRFFRFLLPWNCGFPTFFAFWSHKGLRWFGPLMLILIMLSGCCLMFSYPWIYGIFMIGFASSIALAVIDGLIDLSRASKIFRLIRFVRYFYSMNIALLLGGVEFCRGVTDSIWEPTKRVTGSQSHPGHDHSQTEGGKA